MSDSIPSRRAQRAAAGSRAADGGSTDVLEEAPDAAPRTDDIPAATVAAAPRRPAPLSATPIFPPTLIEQAPAGAAPGAVRIGWEADRASLTSTVAPLRRLESAADVLPELAEDVAAPRPMWRHPAFLVSASLTLVALLALGVFVVLGMLNPPAAATGLSLTTSEDNVRVAWSGPDTAYQVIVVGGPAGDQLDVSQLVTGTEAWIPRGAGLVDDRSCIVVRPAAGAESAPVALDAATLAEQGAVSACIADE